MPKRRDPNDFAESGILADFKPRPARKTKLSGVPYGRPYAEMAAIEPRLLDFLAEVKAVHGVDFESCYMNRWYGYTDIKKGIKYRLERVVGDDTPAFWTAANYLYGQLKMCLHCLGRKPLEVDLENDFVQRIISAGWTAQQQVTTRFGRADIVTDNFVFELKLDLTRVAIFQAIGQASTYAHALGKPRIGIGGRATAETWRLLPALQERGIRVELWNYPVRSLDFQEIV